MPTASKKILYSPLAGAYAGDVGIHVHPPFLYDNYYITTYLSL